jgi:hypothetical protein
MSATKRTFKISSVEGKEVELRVNRPDHKIQAAGQVVHNKAFRDAVEGGALVRAKVVDVMREQKLWDEAKQKRWDELRKKILDGEKSLARGGLRLSQARQIAIQMRRDRWEFHQMSADRNSLDLNTAEAAAENARFNYFVAACTVYADTGKPYFQDYDAYLASDDPAVASAATQMGKLLYGLDDDYEAKLPENRFLLEQKFCRKDLRLVDKQGRLIDATGHRVDEQGRRINDQGELIDDEGNPLTEDGDYKVDFQPWIDDVHEDKDGWHAMHPEPSAA